MNENCTSTKCTVTCVCLTAADIFTISKGPKLRCKKCWHTVEKLPFSFAVSATAPSSLFVVCPIHFFASSAARSEKKKKQLRPRLRPLVAKSQRRQWALWNYLHKFVALQHRRGVKYELAVVNVIFESSHVDVTERHEILDWKDQIWGDGQNQHGASEYKLHVLDSPADLRGSLPIQPFCCSSWPTRYL